MNRREALQRANPLRKCNVCNARPVHWYSNGKYFCADHKSLALERAQAGLNKHRSVVSVRRYSDGVGTFMEPRHGNAGAKLTRGKGWH